MTIDAPCPNCGTIYTVRRDLIGKRTKCTRCGTPFVIAEMAPSQAGPASPPPSAPPSPALDQGLFADIPIHSPYTPHAIPPAAEQSAPRHSAAREFIGLEQDNSRPRYPAIRMVAKGYEILAIMVLIFAAVMLVIEIIRIIINPSAILVVIVSSGLMIVWGLVTALMCLFISQVTRLFLQIEQNTRETGEACRQLADHLSAIEVDK
jgi:predicted Zn finger-like uncharacterized protein